MTVRTRSDLTTEVASQLASNSAGAITATTLRTVAQDIIDSALLQEDGASDAANAAIAAAAAANADASAAAAAASQATADAAVIAVALPGTHRTIGDCIKDALTDNILSVACYGDSHTYGLNPSNVQAARTYPLALQEALQRWYSNAAVYNRGVSGSNAQDVYNKYVADKAASWASTGGAVPDAVIWMAGTNDALANPLTVANYRLYLRNFVNAALADGVVPIIMTPPAPPGTTPSAFAVSPYARTCRRVAEEFNLVCVDAQKQWGWLSSRFTGDGLHYTSYNELGWHLAAIFAPQAGGEHGPMQLGPGTVWGVATLAQFASGGVTGNAAAKEGYAVHIAAGSKIIFAVDPSAPVYPVLSCVNPALTNQIATFAYGGGFASSGIPDIGILHEGARVHREYVGHVARPGLRLIELAVATGTLQVEAIRWVSAEDYQHGFAGLMRKIPLLGMIPPGMIAVATGGAGAAGGISEHDFSLKNLMRVGFFRKGYGTYPNTATLHGLSFAADMVQNTRRGIYNGVELLRTSTTFRYRVITNGVAVDTDVAGTFAASDFTGEIMGVLSGTTFTAYKDSVAIGSGVTVPSAWASGGFFPGKTQYGEVPTFKLDSDTWGDS